MLPSYSICKDLGLQITEVFSNCIFQDIKWYINQVNVVALYPVHDITHANVLTNVLQIKLRSVHKQAFHKWNATNASSTS